MKRDPEMTERFHEAVKYHDEELNEIMKDVEEGRIDLTEVTEADIVGGLRALTLDKRRPAVQLGALTRLAEMKGMLKNKDHQQVGDDRLEAMLDELEQRRNGVAEADEPAV